MKELDECLKLNREKDRIIEKLQTIIAAAYAPKNQIISDLPRGSGSTINATDRYIIKKEKLEQEIAVLNRDIERQWNEACRVMNKCGVTSDERELMRYRFYYGLPWKQCEAEMKSKHGSRWNVNRVFRTYRKVLTKCTK